MSTTGETSRDHADHLVEQIKNNDIDPSNINLDPFINDDLTGMTPELWDELPETKRQEYNDRVAERDRDELHDERRELSEAQEHAIEQLNAPAPEDTTTVELRNGIVVKVKTHTSTEIEDKIAEIEDHWGDFDRVRQEIVEVLTWFILDDDYGDPAVWRAHIEEYGIVSAAAILVSVFEPAKDRIEVEEEVRGFRGNQ